jgi:ABC-type nitrate/sulfonate/bicarbonate transport system substrate-binding protein
MMVEIKKTLVAVAVGLTSVLAVTGCSAPTGASDTSRSTEVAATAESPTLRLGYFDNATHGPALVGLQRGTFAESLGQTELTAQIFSAGPAVIEALSAGALDAAYIGPSPAINSFVKSAGASLVIVSGVTRGGASLVVRDGITAVSDLEGTVLASPQLGNTQDVALRSWLDDQGYETTVDGGGDVAIQPTENAQTLDLFKSGAIDGAWLPEPWASRLIVEAGANELVNEADLWDEGKFPTTVLAVSKDFFDQYPGTVARLVEANDSIISWMTENPSEVAATINAQLMVDTGKTLSDEVLTRALSRLTFTPDPDAAAFVQLKAHAVALTLAKDGSLEGLFRLDALNALVAARGGEAINAGSLGGK